MIRQFVLLLAGVCLPAFPVFAQAVNATIVGTVTDSAGGLMPRTSVVVTETATGVSHSLKTNDSGNYTLPDLPPGTYSVSAEQTGFRREEKQGISLLVNSSVRVDLQLHPGSVSEAIEITGAPPPLQTDRADVTVTMDTQLLESMPVGVNRNFQSLLDLVPGTTPATFQHSQFFNASSSLQTQVNGQPRMGNSLQIEGIDDNQRTGLLQILIPPMEAIQVVNSSTSNHDPELGRGSGAITNVILKSGTNKLHAAIYEFLQNSAFDARSFFNPVVGHLAYNYVGGNVGGAIKRNKVFYFTDYLRTMDHEANTNQTTIPSVEFRKGDLSAGKNQVYDPATGDIATGIGRLPFAGNIIPPSRINPVSAKILTYLPATNETFDPSRPSNNYFALLPAQKTNDSVDAKVDYNIGDKNRLSGRFSFSHPVTFQAPIFGDAGGPAQSAFQGSGFQKTYSSGLNYNHVLSATLLTEFRIGVAHYHNEARQSDYGKNDSTAIGVNGVNVNEFTSGFVGISIGNFTSPLVGYSASLPWIRAEANIDLVNSWTKILRNHTIKWGADVRRIRDDLLQDQTFSPRGLITFGTNQTFAPGAPGGTGVANDMASFLLDVPSQVARDVNTYFPALRAWQVFSYVADSWQATPRLTINPGVRWEFYPPTPPQFAGGFSNYNFVDNTLTIAGVGGVPNDLGVKTRYKYFSPRFGAAYRLTNTTVMRAAFGLSFTPFPDNNWAYNFPVRANNQYNTLGGNSYAPAAFPDGSLATFERGFPAVPPIAVPSNGIITNPDPTSAYNIIPLNYRNPYVEQWNFAVGQALPYHFTLDVAYVGNHGVGTPAATNLNAGQVLGAGSKGQPQYPRTANSIQYFRGLSSMYNGLQIKLDRGYSKGLRITTAFTWSKAMDFQTGDDGGLLFYVGQQRNWARADFDRTLNYVQSYIYELPFGKGKTWLARGMAGKIVGGWQVSGILSARTGTPLTFTDGGSLSLPGSTQTPNQIAPIEILHGINVGNPWFSTTSFQTPVGAVFGTLGRNVISGPGLFSINGKVSRSITLGEARRYTLDLRLETLNLTNTAQFANPQLSHTNSNFGFITGTLSTGTGVNGTGGGRVVQLGAKISF